MFQFIGGYLTRAQVEKLSSHGVKKQRWQICCCYDEEWMSGRASARKIREIYQDFRSRDSNIWVKITKNGPSKICGRQPLKKFQIFSKCLLQISLGSFSASILCPSCSLEVTGRLVNQGDIKKLRFLINWVFQLRIVLSADLHWF